MTVNHEPNYYTELRFKIDPVGKHTRSNPEKWYVLVEGNARANSQTFISTRSINNERYGVYLDTEGMKDLITTLRYILKQNGVDTHDV